MDPEDQPILEEIRTGNWTAFPLIYRKYARRLFNTAYRLAGNKADAEDILQETCLRILQGIEKYRWRSSFYTWAYRILLNTWIDFRKKSRPRQIPSPDERISELFLTPHETDQEVEVQNILRQLPPKLRTVLVLKEIEGLSYREIGEVLGCSEGTVASRLSRARQRFAELYRPGVSSQARTPGSLPIIQESLALCRCSSGPGTPCRCGCQGCSSP